MIGLLLLAVAAITDCREEEPTDRAATVPAASAVDPEEVHTFANGVKVYADQLIPGQRRRYAEVNLHEPVETGLLTDCIKQADRGDVFIDIGGAIGYYSFLAKLTRPDLEVHTLNPSPRFREWMARNAKLNQIDDIVVHKEAVSDRDGQDFYLGRGYGDGISRAERKEQMDKVKTITIDTLVGNIRKPVHLIKMDIQGGEVAALRGATASLKHVKNFMIGTHGEEVHEECLKILERNGYEIKFDQGRKAIHLQPDGLIWAAKTSKAKDSDVPD